MKKKAAFLATGLALLASGVSVLGALIFSPPNIPGEPNTSFTSGGPGLSTPFIKYTASSGDLVLRSGLTATRFAPGATGLMPGTDSVEINILVDNAGVLVGGTAGHDFIMKGSVTDPRLGGLTYTGTTDASPLLTGEIVAFGFLDGGIDPLGTPFGDNFEFRFRVTGGALASFYSGKDIGVQVINDNGNTFVDFTTDFRGGVVKGNVGPVTRPPGECTGTLGDYVWHDENHDGIQDGFEHGIQGVTMTLTPSTPPGPVQTTTTDVNGYYQFSGLCRGDYTVAATDPVGYSPTLTGAGTTSTDSNPNPTFVSYATDNFNDQTIDFGYVTPCTASIGDFVWMDDNRNGVQDPGEPGRNGVTVQLLDSADTVIATQTTHNHPVTGAPGYYKFDGLCFGDYKVHVVLPGGGETFTFQDQGGDDAKDSDADQTTGTTGSYHLDDNTEDLTVDIGLVPPCDGTIGDFVWDDLDHDGIQDPGEVGIDGVVVTLSNSGGPIQTFTTTTHSGQTGWYQFTGLCADSYTVSVPRPAGYTNFSPTKNPAGTFETDSDGTPTVDLTTSVASVTLTLANMNDQTIDFGFYLAAPNVTIKKYTNTFDAQTPNDADVPNISVGGAVTWRYDVTNTGNMPVAKADVVVTDDHAGVTPVPVLVGGFVSGDTNTNDILDPTETWIYQATGVALNLALTPLDPGKIVAGVCTHNGSEPPRTGYVNTGTVTIPGPVSATDPSAYCNPRPPQLRVVKTPDGGTFIQGAQVSYQIVVSNPAAAGAESATNVQLTDALPSNGGLVWATATTTQGTCGAIVGNSLSCALGTLAPGASATVTVTSTATTPLAACQSQPNPAAIATATGGLTAQDSGSLICTPPPPPPPNVRIEKVGNGPINLGGLAMFTIKVTNDGPGSATGVRVTDTLPAGFAWTENQAACSIISNVMTCNIGTMAQGQIFTVVLSATTTAAAFDCNCVNPIHRDDDHCDHEQGKGSHHDGDGCDHEKATHHHRDGDGCDHEKRVSGHYSGDGCDHDKKRHSERHSSGDSCAHERGAYGHRSGDGCTHEQDLRRHHDGDGCDHDRDRNGHRDGDGCQHEKDMHHHYAGDGCDHERGRFGHRDGDGCDHDKDKHPVACKILNTAVVTATNEDPTRRADNSASASVALAGPTHHDGDGCEHERRDNGHKDGDGCEHEKATHHHYSGDGCDHDRRASGHFYGDACDHERDRQQDSATRYHHEGDGCDHDKGQNGHHDGDGCQHERDMHHHYSGDGCDHERGRFGHKDGDRCDHDKEKHHVIDSCSVSAHFGGDGDDHETGRNGHHSGDGCDHDRSSSWSWWSWWSKW